MKTKHARPMSLGWRQALVFTHRWLGIATGPLFVAWFSSGVVMMYARMPELPADEATRRLPPLDLSRARSPLATAVAGLPSDIDRVRVAMLGDRPVYRVSSGRVTRTIYAETGEPLHGVAAEEALALAGTFAPERAATVRYDEFLADADQWTFGVRAAAPFHRLALGDVGDTRLYVSAGSGEIVMRTTAAERRLAYAGAVLHWLYFAPLRRHAAVWTQTIIWLSVVGCVMCLTGLAWGLMRARHSPYTGLMKWHHYAGLIFGATTFAFLFSGLLSMGPWDWSPGTAPTREQRYRAAGGALAVEALTPQALRNVLSRLNESQPERCRQLDVHQVMGSLFARCGEVIAPFDSQSPPARQLTEDAIEALASIVMPGTSIAASEWLDEYDAYYYARDRARPLPVLRVQYADPDNTWLYFDPRTGSIARREVSRTRLERWLYHGLHSLDFPFLYYRRPLWDAVVVALSIGGLVLSTTTLLPGWRRVRRRVVSRP